MGSIFVNLKRFDVPRDRGGICPREDPYKWAEYLIEESVNHELGQLQTEDLTVTYLMPEALILPAVRKLKSYADRKTNTLEIGCQGVFREDIEKEGNFGAFTSNLPATAAANLGCSWSIIGHSEERKDKKGIIEAFNPAVKENRDLKQKTEKTVNEIINQEAIKALQANLNLLLCVGETAAQRGKGEFSHQKPRIESVLKEQLTAGLKGVTEFAEKEIVIGYEPIWAIGPGKTPPGEEYIGYVSRYIKRTVREKFHFEPAVVYGGGLKEENAEMISGIENIDGGLVGLTKFTPPIEFEPAGLRDIIDKYLQ